MIYSIKATKKQKEFMDATESEVLFGGAAGGGKSFAQVLDALRVALTYPGSRQLILRRTFSELDKSLIRTSLEVYPREIYTYGSVSHTGRFKNGSIIDFGYLASETDVYQYQSAEYDVVRFDELTHFTEAQYLYLISRVRGTGPAPKQIKSTTNPGGTGHAWVKRRFIDKGLCERRFVGEDGMTRIFIPSRLSDNRFLTAADPHYKDRLLALPERERRALLFGDWEVFEGQYFSEFSHRLHVISPFEIPHTWRKYRTIDYGLDRLACLWIAVSPEGRAYVYREYCESNLAISLAAAAILERTPKNEEIYATLAPPDLWARSQESGRSRATIFSEFGLSFSRTSNDRECGWLAVKELLRDTGGGPGLQIFSTCHELIECLPSLTVDKSRPSDCSTEPHRITHAPDALRGFAIYKRAPVPEVRPTVRWTADMWEDYATADASGRKYLKQKYGEPN